MTGGKACLDELEHTGWAVQGCQMRTWIARRIGLVCQDVSRYRGGGRMSRRAKCAPGGGLVRVGVPGCEGPSTHWTHFQAGQRRTSKLMMSLKVGTCSSCDKLRRSPW